MTISIKQRLNDHKVMQVYRHMIKTQDVEVVKELRKNIKAQADGHAKQLELEELFIERLGE